MDIHITYEALFDILRKERSLNELQPLNEDFWSHVVGYIKDRNEQAKTSKGLSETEKMRLQLMNVKRIVKDIYERREKKILNLALNVVKTESSSFVDTQTMLDIEKELFREILAMLKSYKEGIVSRVFIGKEPDLKKITSSSARKKIIEATKDEIGSGSVSIDQTSTKPVATSSSGTSSTISVEFLSDVPRFLGKNKEVMGPYSSGQSATLPKPVADVLIQKGRAKEV